MQKRVLLFLINAFLINMIAYAVFLLRGQDYISWTLAGISSMTSVSFCLKYMALSLVTAVIIPLVLYSIQKKKRQITKSIVEDAIKPSTEETDNEAGMTTGQSYAPPPTQCLKNRKAGIEPAKLFIYTLIFYLTFMVTASLMSRGGDLAVHGLIAVENVSLRNPFLIFQRISYPVWHILTNIFYRLFGDVIYAAAFVTAGFNLFTTIVIYNILKRYLKEKFSANTICAITFLLSFVTAIWLPWFSPHIYLGPASPTLWHNPTSNAVKGLSILFFFLYMDIYAEKDLNGKNRMTLRQMAFMTGLMFLSTLLKSSFIVLFIPSAFILLLIDLIRSKGKNIVFCLQTALVCIPALVPTLHQYIYSYSADTKRGGLAFSFMAVASSRTTNVPLTLMLPYMFPALVYLLQYKDIYKNKRLFFALIMVIVSTVYYLFFAEANNPLNNELGWPRALAMIIIWVVTAIEFFNTYHQSRHTEVRASRKNMISVGFVLMFMHFFTGVIYYVGYGFMGIVR